MGTYKISAEGDVQFVVADNEDEAFRKLTEFYGSMPRSIVNIEEHSGEIPPDHDVIS